jgi:hypothetical protein
MIIVLPVGFNFNPRVLIPQLRSRRKALGHAIDRPSLRPSGAVGQPAA